MRSWHTSHPSLLRQRELVHRDVPALPTSTAGSPSPSPEEIGQARQDRCVASPRWSDRAGPRPAPEARRAAGGTSPEETPRSLLIPGALPSTHPQRAALLARWTSLGLARLTPGRAPRTAPGNGARGTGRGTRPSSNQRLRDG